MKKKHVIKISDIPNYDIKNISLQEFDDPLSCPSKSDDNHIVDQDELLVLMKSCE